MKVEILPSKATGKIQAPSSKSYAHRILICAALAEGTSVIENIGTNDDILATAQCLRELGADIKIDGTTAVVKGIKTAERKKLVSLFCNESGSTLRFLIPLSLVLFENAQFGGKGRLMERPQSVYEELFSENGCYLEKEDKGLLAGGELKSGVFKVRGDVSSQFITGLMLALPLLSGDSEIVLTTELESAPYVDITIGVLSLFGVNITKTDKGFYIKGDQKYTPQNLTVEGDWSNAAFLDAFNLAGGMVELTGLNNESLQGDKVYREFYDSFSSENPVFDISQCPDLGPVLISASVIKNGALINGTRRLKIKESDRAEAMKEELLKFGVDIEVGDDFVKIPYVTPHRPTAPMDCHNDHRIAMSLAVLCSVTGGVLDGAQCVNKSYPGFFEDVKKLGIKYKII